MSFESQNFELQSNFVKSNMLESAVYRQQETVAAEQIGNTGRNKVADSSTKRAKFRQRQATNSFLVKDGVLSEISSQRDIEVAEHRNFKKQQSIVKKKKSSMRLIPSLFVEKEEEDHKTLRDQSPSLKVKEISVAQNNLSLAERKAENAKRRADMKRKIQEEKYERWKEEMKQFEKGLFRMHGKVIRYDPKSLFLLSYKSKLRQQIVWVIESKVFEVAIIIFIIINSLTMAMFDYQDRTSQNAYNQRLNYIQLILTIIFSIEAILRILGMGFIFDQNSYIRDPWNWIDLFSILAGWIEQTPYVPKLKYLRTLRVIRPLRGIKAVPSMRRLILSLLKSLPMMGNVVVFLFFFFVLFGILGVSLFKGRLHDRCRLTQFPVDRIWAIDDSQQNICSITETSYVCKEGTFCGGPSQLDDPESYDNPDFDELTYYGYMNYDHLGQALMTVYQIITLEGWSKLMYKLQDSDSSFLSPIYFLFFVVFGGFFLMNLILAVILDSFERVDKQQRVQELQDKLKKLDIESRKTLIEKMRTKGRHAQQTKQNATQHATEAEKISIVTDPDSSIQTEQYFEDENDEMKSSLSSDESREDQSRRGNLLENFKQHNQVIDRLKERKSVLSPKRRDIIDGLNPKIESPKFLLGLQKSFDQGQQANSGMNSAHSVKESQQRKKEREANKSRNSKLIQPRGKKEGENFDSDGQERQESSKLDYTIFFRKKDELNSSEKVLKINLVHRLKSSKLQKKTYKLIISRPFNFLVYVVAIINTLTICLDRYPISLEETRVYDMINIACFGFFSIEFIIKIFALGPKLYFRDRYNVLDCIVIAVQIVDITLREATTFTSSLFLGFSAAKLMRIFKLAKQWESFQTLISKILKSLKDITNFSVLMFIFMFTFAILGMELFAERIKFDEDNNPIDIDDCNDQDGCVGLGISPRFNFDRWNNAMISIFVLIIGDDWNTIMFDYARASADWSIMYFFFITAFGNVVLLNLFLAILLKDFDYEHDEDSDTRSQQEKPARDYLLYVVRFIKIQFVWVLRGCQKNKVRKYDIENLEDHGQGFSVNHELDPRAGDKFENSNSLVFSQISQSNDAANRSLNESRDPIVDRQRSQSQKRQSLHQSGFEEQGQSLLDENNPQRNPESRVNIKQFSRENSRRSSRIIVRDHDTTALLNNNNESRIHNLSSPEANSILFPRQIVLPTEERKSLKNRIDPYNKKSGLQGSTHRGQTNGAQLFSSELKLKSSEQEVNSINRFSELSAKPLQHSQTANLFNRVLTEHLMRTQASLEGKTLYMFKKDNRLRVKIARIIRHPIFDSIFLVLILISTIILALDEPLTDPDAGLNFYLDKVDFALSSLFFIESILKIVTVGLLVNGEKSYLRSFWNTLDFTIVVLSLVSQILYDQFKVIKSLRLFRVLRPLRVLSKNEQLKVAVQCLFYSFKDIANVFLITIFVFAGYSIFGVNFYKGNFYECISDHLPASLTSKLTIDDSFTKWHCISMGGVWINNRSNFDNVFYGALTLFQMSTTEGWSNAMLNGIDSTKPDHTYDKDRNQWNALYFVFFILLGSLFMINLFVGVVINSFKYEKEKMSLSYLLSDTQKEMLMIEINCLKDKPNETEKLPKNRVRRFVYKFIKHRAFNIVMNIMIFLNILMFCFNWYLMDDRLAYVFETMTYVFTAIFSTELLLKLFALDRKFFKDGYNIFGCVVLAGTYLQIILTNSLGKSFGPQLHFLRVFRLGRMFRLIKKAKSLDSIFTSFLNSLPSLANIGLLLFMLVYLYAILGLNLFSRVKLHGELDDHANFQNFINSFLTMIRCATGEGWNDIMKSLMDQRSISYDCMEDPTWEDIAENGGVPNGCGDYWIALFFFCSYQLLVTFISLNLFIAIIIDSFQETSLKQNLRVDEVIMKKFKEIWQQYDKEGSGFIDCKNLDIFFRELIMKDVKLIRGGEYLVRIQGEMSKFIAELHLPVYNSFQHYHFYDVLLHLVKSLFKVDFDKALMVRQDINFEGQGSRRSNETIMQNAIRHQDQMQFNSFEELLADFNETVKKRKVQLYEQFKQLKQNADRRKHRHRDKYNQVYYDSRIIIYMPALIRKLRFYTKRMKEERLKYGDNFLQIRAAEMSQNLQAASNPLISKLQNRGQKQSIFATLARASENQEKQDSLRIQNSSQINSESSLRGLRVREQNSLQSSHHQISNHINSKIKKQLGDGSHIQDSKRSNQADSLSNHSRQNISSRQDKISNGATSLGGKGQIKTNIKHSQALLLEEKKEIRVEDSSKNIQDLGKKASDNNLDQRDMDSQAESNQIQRVFYGDGQNTQKSSNSMIDGISPISSPGGAFQARLEGIKTNQKNRKKLSGMALTQQDSSKVAPSSGLDKLRKIEQEIIIEEEHDCESPLPQLKNISESETSSVESNRSRKELNKRNKKRKSKPLEGGIAVVPMKILSDVAPQIVQSPIITISQPKELTSRSSSSNTSKNQNQTYYSPMSSKPSNGAQHIFAAKINSRKLLPDYLVVKIQPDEVIDEEKSYEETVTQKMHSVHNLTAQRNSQQFNSSTSQYDFKHSQDAPLSKEEGRRRASMNIHTFNTSKLIGAAMKKYKMSSFAIEAIKKSSLNNRSSQDQSLDNKNQSVLAFNQVKGSESSEHSQIHKDIEKPHIKLQNTTHLRSSNYGYAISPINKASMQVRSSWQNNTMPLSDKKKRGVGYEQILDPTLDEEDLNQMIRPDEFLNSSVSGDRDDINQTLPFEGGGSEYLITKDKYNYHLSVAQSRKNLHDPKMTLQVHTALRKKSDNIFTNAENLASLRVEESQYNENERHMTHSNKKFSSNTTQLFLNSFQDIMSISKRSSNKLSSMRYQQAYDESKEIEINDFEEERDREEEQFKQEPSQMLLNESRDVKQLGGEQELMRNKSVSIEKINQDKAKQKLLEIEEQKSLVANQARTREAKLKELLNIDIDSSDISSDLYLDDDDPLRFSPDGATQKGSYQQKVINKKKVRNADEFVDSVSVSEALSQKKTFKGATFIAKNFDSPLVKLETKNNLMELNEQIQNPDFENQIERPSYSEKQKQQTIKPQLMEAISKSESQLSPIQTSEEKESNPKLRIPDMHENQKLNREISQGLESPEAATITNLVNKEQQRNFKNNSGMLDRFWIKINQQNQVQQVLNNTVEQQPMENFLSISADLDDENLFSMKSDKKL